jgi:pyrroloquinoline-quinone synthase
MSTKESLDLSVSKRNLLEHPFYQAWSAGTLPVECLRTYAREYGAFIGLLPDAWETLRDEETAHEEREHAELWDRFAGALGTHVAGSANLPQVQALTATAVRLFSDPASAAGGLYAFEVQQPATAQSKLAGLKTHYHFPAEVEPYFEIHSHNEHEARKLSARIQDLSPVEQSRAVQACSEMAEALWNALTGIYGDDKMTDC